MTQPTVYMLIGVPCSGKSTFVKTQDQDFVYVSSDYFVEKFAQKMGMTYNEVFGKVAHRAMRLVNRRVQTARRNKRDIIWDQTNTGVKSRAKKLARLPEYRKVAVYFETPPDDVLAERLASRPGKLIPNHVMRTMKNGLVLPVPEEGFSEIRTIYNQ
jgi:predicted kinase